MLQKWREKSTHLAKERAGPDEHLVQHDPDGPPVDGHPAAVAVAVDGRQWCGGWQWMGGSGIIRWGGSSRFEWYTFESVSGSIDGYM
jgi:hypothetical protein